MWVGLIQSAEGLARTEKLMSPEQEGIEQQTAFGLELHHLPGAPASWTTLQVLNLPAFIIM